MNFSDLLNESKKSASVAHSDIDRWLKSVDGLAKDLNALKDAKAKAKGKMDQIGKFKPKSSEVIDSKQSDRKSLSPKPEKKPELERKDSKPNRQFRDEEDSLDVKRVIEDRPNLKKSKPSNVEKDVK